MSGYDEEDPKTARNSTIFAVVVIFSMFVFWLIMGA